MNKSYEQVLALQQSNKSEQPDESDTEDESDCSSECSRSSATSSSASFTAVANPCDQDTYVFSTNYALANKGTSHRIHFGKWDKLLEIL
jgi:hypothetical protein